MRSKRIPAKEQYCLIMECRQSGLTDHQWCVETRHQNRDFLQLQKGCVRKVVDLVSVNRTQLSCTGKPGRSGVDFRDNPGSHMNSHSIVILVATERNNLSVAEPMKLSVGSFHLTIPNGTDPQLLAQTLRIVKELEC